MRTNAKFIDIGMIDITVEITMSLNDWKQLKNQLVDSHPSWTLSNHIREVISKLDTIARAPND
jgi:hypothetical protein